MEEKKFAPKLIGLEVLSMEATRPDDVAARIPVQFIVNVDTRVSAEKKIIINVPRLKVLDKENQTVQLGSLSIAVTYELENFNEAAKQREDGDFDIDEALDKRLTIIPLNTLRGVAYALFRTTYLSSIVLPMFEADALVKNKK